MSSTLVETVSIDYEDFTDSFLTCGTCLCSYDAIDHNPKLLPCSHTVCKSCLERILEAQGRDSTTVRCPICRETITLPRGGVTSFPPSFIVNQLLDLMARQRRDIIPKCSIHPMQELMFCETCDTVFCMDCTGGSHNGRGASAHTVIPFSIAIKRMSEILLYKASLCMRNLNNAHEMVTEELQRLDISAEATAASVTKSFQELSGVLEQRRMEVIQMIHKIRDEKVRVLSEQLAIIRAEKERVQSDCNSMQNQVEVRSITKRIADLNEKLDSSTTLSEPRENAHMRFEYKKNAAYCDFMNAINNFGSIAVSKTFPALCMTKIEKPVVHLKTSVTLTTVDYHGNPRTSGADPVGVELKNPWGEAMPIDLKDNDDGTYSLNFTAHAAGRHKLCINIFDRPVKDSPFTLEVTEHNSPVQKIGSRGDGSLHFKQPINVVIDQHNNLCILDAGNSRIQILDRDGQYIGALANHGMEQHSGTGLALTPNNTFVVVNWRTKHVTELDHEGAVALKFTHEDFLAPTSVAVNRHGDIIIADNEACCLFMFSATGQFLRTVGTKGSKEGQFKLITAVAIGNNDEILVTDHRLQVFTRQGTFVTEVRPGSDVAKGQYHGVTVDRHGNILATRSNFVQVFNAQKKWVFDIDSFDDKLNRPHGLSATTDGHVYVADLGNDCLKVFRYM